MLNHTLEFLRIADVQPNHEKVGKRQESATELLAHISNRENRATLLDVVQGVVGGFEGAPFSQDAPAVALVIKSIKDRDALPQDLTENANELRAVAAIAIGELLIKDSDAPGEESVLAALALDSALSSRSAAANKHIRWMLETLGAASGKVLVTAARRRRNRGNGALTKLEKLKKPAEGDVWDAVMPVVRAAIREVSAQEIVDREELETLWWMFGGYSEVVQKPLAELAPATAAFCSGVELAQLALLPPSRSALAMVKRSVESPGRKASTLAAISLQDAIGEWSAPMIGALAPSDGESDSLLSGHPALLPLSYACLRLRECKDAPKLGKDFTASTGLPLTHTQTPAQWGGQVFREAVLQRFVASKEN